MSASGGVAQERASNVDAADERPLLAALRPIHPFAAFTGFVVVVAAVLVPASHGWIVGISRAVEMGDTIAEGLTQALALFSLFAVAGLGVQLTVSRTPIPLRIVGVLLAMIVGLGAVVNVGIDRFPGLVILHAIVGTCATVLAIVLGADVLRCRSISGLVPVLVGVASLLRGSGAFLAERAMSQQRDVESIRVSFARAETLATAGGVVALLACGAAIGWLVRIDRQRGAIIGAASTLAALFFAWRGAAEVDPDEPAWSVLVRRMAQAMWTLPAGHLPGFLRTFLAVSPIVFGVVCIGLAPRRLRTSASSVGLILLAGVSAEVPLFALSLVVGALALEIDRRDPYGVVAAVRATTPPVARAVVVGPAVVGPDPAPPSPDVVASSEHGTVEPMPAESASPPDPPEPPAPTSGAPPPERTAESS